MSKGIFLGSFNPPHIGHKLCIETIVESMMMEFLEIDRIHIIPAYQNPNKVNTVDYWTRYRMCRAMFRSMSDYALVDDIENDIKPKYTYDLISYLKDGKDTIIGKDFWWFITEETFLELLNGKWYKSKELLRNNKFVILYNGEDIHGSIRTCNAEYGTIKIKNPVSVHSTKIREMVSKSMDVSQYTTSEVIDIIKEEKLYI